MFGGRSTRPSLSADLNGETDVFPFFSNKSIMWNFCDKRTINTVKSKENATVADVNSRTYYGI